MVTDRYPAVRTYIHVDRIDGRKSERGKVGRTHERGAERRDVFPAHHRAKAKDVLSPIDVAVDEISRRIAAGQGVEIREVVGMRKRRGAQMAEQEGDGDTGGDAR